MARKRYQRGSVFLEGTRNPAWYGRWREDVVDAAGNRRRVDCKQVLGYKRDIPTKRLALRELEKRLSPINSTTYKPLRNATVGEFIEKWKKEILPHTMKPSTQSSVLSQLRRLEPTLMQCTIKDCGTSTLQHYVSTWASSRSPKTVRNLVMTLRSIWKSARAQDYISTDPFENLALPRLEKSEQRFFTADEMRRIIEAAEEPYKTFYWLAAETGLRAGELCGLKWEDVHAGHVQVRSSVWRGHFGKPKSARGERACAISGTLSAHVLSQRAEGCGMSLVFKTSNGTPWDANLVVKRKLRPLLGRLGFPMAGLHAFRHGNETIMDQASTPVAVRLQRLGHADTRMMVNYSHVVSADDRAAAEHIATKLVSQCVENENGFQDCNLENRVYSVG
jgi:integrase